MKPESVFTLDCISLKFLHGLASMVVLFTESAWFLREAPVAFCAPYALALSLPIERNPYKLKGHSDTDTNTLGTVNPGLIISTDEWMRKKAGMF